MGWQDDQIVQAAAPAQPWENDAIVAPAAGPHVAQGLGEAWQAGYQGSVGGLMDRGKLPDIVLDAHHSKWYEKLAAGASQLINEAPEMIAGGWAGAAGGAAIGGAAGSVVPGIGTAAGAAVGGVLGGGAGAFAAPTAIREGLMQYYDSQGPNASSADFLARSSIVIKHTAKDALIGAVTGGVGAGVGKLAAPLVESAVAAGKIGATTGKVAQGAAVTGSELTAMTVTPAALEGRLPEAQDFANGAILLAGMKGAGFAVGRLRSIYAQTGVRPEQVVADAKADPTIVEDLTAPVTTPPTGELALVPKEEIPRAYQPLAHRQAAVDAFPGVKAEPRAEEVLNNPFADIPETKMPWQLNMRTINGPEELKALQTRIAETYHADIDAARGGTQSWTETGNKAATQIADLTGADIAKVMAGRNVGDTANAVQLDIMGKILMQATVEAGSAIKRVKDAGLDVTDAMKLEAHEAIGRLAMVQADFTGAAAETARALQYMQRTKQIREQAAGIQKLTELYRGDPDMLLKMAGEIGTPEGLAKFAREANKATTWDKVREAIKAAMVSGPITQLVNAAGNTTLMAVMPVRDLAAAGFGRAFGATERVHATEPFARVWGNLQGVSDGLKVAKLAFLEDAAAGKAEQFQAAIGGTTGYVIRTPFRALAAADGLFRTMIERGEAYAIGARQAASEGFNPATREFIARAIAVSQDLTPKQADAVTEAGLRGTFQAPPGEAARKIFAAIESNPVTQTVVPFKLTPLNVFKEALRISPAAPLSGEWRAAFAEGGVAKQRAMAELALGTALFGLTASWAAAGHISGNGPVDPNKRRAMVAAGWQPYSIKINDKWYSYQRIQPLGMVVGAAADAATIAAESTTETGGKLAQMGAAMFANAVTNATFLQGLTQLNEVISDPQRHGPKFINSLVTMPIPGALKQTAQVFDPYMREVNSIGEAVRNSIPGVREGLTPTRDIFGEPQANAANIVGVKVSTESNDPVRKEAARLGVGAPEAPKSITVAGAKFGRQLSQKELSAEQRDIFGAEAGHLAHQILTPMVNSPGWAYMPDAVKQMAFKQVFEKANAFGKFKALSMDERQVEVERIQSEIAKKLAPPAAP